MLELIEEALDEVAFAIECEIACPLDLAIGLGRDDGSDPPAGEDGDEGIGIVALVANQGFGLGVFDERLGADEKWACPGVSINSTGLPKASMRAWIFVVSPPRDLPIACGPFFSRPG